MGLFLLKSLVVRGVLDGDGGRPREHVQDFHVFFADRLAGIEVVGQDEADRFVARDERDECELMRPEPLTEVLVHARVLVRVVHDDRALAQGAFRHNMRGVIQRHANALRNGVHRRRGLLLALVVAGQEILERRRFLGELAPDARRFLGAGRAHADLALDEVPVFVHEHQHGSIEAERLAGGDAREDEVKEPIKIEYPLHQLPQLS